MKLITRNTDYAVRALCFIANSDKEIVTVTELVEKLKIPLHFLRRILQVLSKKGILYSYKGRDGGFSLAIPTEKIVIADIIAAFQGELVLNECMFKKRICGNIKTCPLRKEITEIEKDVKDRLRLISIQSLLDGGK